MLRVSSGSLLACLLFLVCWTLGPIACNDRKCPPNSPCPTPSPPPNTCTNIAGTRNMFWSESCGRSGQGTIVVAQSGCGVTAPVANLGTVTGTISGSSMTFTVTFSDPCTGTATGTAPVSSNPIVLSYTGSETGAPACCGQVTGTITFDNSPPTTPTVTPTPGP